MTSELVVGGGGGVLGEEAKMPEQSGSAHLLRCVFNVFQKKLQPSARCPLQHLPAVFSHRIHVLVYMLPELKSGL